MRNPGTEPLVSLGEDVIGLTERIYAERAAAEGLVRALEIAERFLAHRVNGDFFGALNGMEAEGYTLEQVRAALAAWKEATRG